MPPTEQRTCVICHQPLQSASKLAQMQVPQHEAQSSGWTGERNADGTITVSMCIQCQIDRSKLRKATLD